MTSWNDERRATNEATNEATNWSHELEPRTGATNWSIINRKASMPSRRDLIVSLAATLGISSARLRALGQPPPRPKFQAGVEVVTITATVTDAAGRLVTDLSIDD